MYIFSLLVTPPLWLFGAPQGRCASPFENRCTKAFYFVISEEENVAMETVSSVKYLLAVKFCVTSFLLNIY
jgi:hypothetical protein